MLVFTISIKIFFLSFKLSVEKWWESEVLVRILALLVNILWYGYLTTHTIVKQVNLPWTVRSVRIMRTDSLL